MLVKCNCNCNLDGIEGRREKQWNDSIITALFFFFTLPSKQSNIFTAFFSMINVSFRILVYAFLFFRYHLEWVEKKKEKRKNNDVTRKIAFNGKMNEKKKKKGNKKVWKHISRQIVSFLLSRLELSSDWIHLYTTASLLSTPARLQPREESRRTFFLFVFQFALLAYIKNFLP